MNGHNVHTTSTYTFPVLIFCMASTIPSLTWQPKLKTKKEREREMDRQTENEERKMEREREQQRHLSNNFLTCTCTFVLCYMSHSLCGHTLPAIPTHLIPQAVGDIEPGTGWTLLATVLKGRSDSGVYDVGNVCRFMDQVKVLSSTLTDKSGEGPGKKKKRQHIKKSREQWHSSQNGLALVGTHTLN